MGAANLQHHPSPRKSGEEEKTSHNMCNVFAGMWALPIYLAVSLTTVIWVDSTWLTVYTAFSCHTPTHLFATGWLTSSQLGGHCKANLYMPTA